MLADFKKFIMRGNVIDLAVAVVIGAAFKAVVDAFIAFIINPIIAAIFGKPDVTQVLNITLRETDDGSAVLSIGGFLQEVINFLIVGAAIFVAIRTYEEMQKRRAQGAVDPEEAPEPSEEVVLLTQIRDSLANR